jgi:ribosomal protein S4
MKLKKLLDFTINKLSRKRGVNTIFYPEQRLDVFLARFFNKTIENIHTDILHHFVLVNNKLVTSYDFVLRNKDFIYLWKDRLFFQRSLKNILRRCRFNYNSLVFNHISFPNLGIICFLEKTSFNYLEHNPIRKGFVKRAYI